jgi:hypothetical protein
MSDASDLEKSMAEYRKLQHVVSVFKAELVVMLTPEGMIFSRNGSNTGYRFSRPSASGCGDWRVDAVQVPTL